MRIEDYLRLVTSQIRCKKACPCVEKELENHIMDQMDTYVKAGMDKEEALDKADQMLGHSGAEITVIPDGVSVIVT